jgi:protein involved in polysaccharide export with SLBB domain
MMSKLKNCNVTIWLVVFATCPTMGQSPTKTEARPRVQQGAYAVDRPVEASELAKDNNARVAASAVQIKDVLVKDAGIMVELKRWIAKEATDNGQIVEDVSLTDQAIFDRLDRDIVFRSVATRVLQRYGYLAPAINPDSDFAKEQDLILKERARRLVALEGQEDAEAMQARKPATDTKADHTTDCDSQDDQDCEDQQAKPRRSRRPSQYQGQPPDWNSYPTLPPDIPSFSQDQRTLRSSYGGDDQGRFDRSSLSSAYSSSSPSSSSYSSMGLGLDLNSEMIRSGSDMGRAVGQGPTIDDLLAGRNSSSMTDRYGNNELSMSGGRGGTVQQSLRPRRQQRYRPPTEDSAGPVKMVRAANPYADIPSLYDMYVQAAAWQRPTERFGLEVFRNSTTDPDIIPIDLPVGPEYVVGPGDSLSIDLWGGISQRMMRTVDRGGRISLPESGPVLVSGKTLGDVQASVQRVLRSQYRDVSVDVSVSRLRTVRIYVVGEVVSPGAYDVSSMSTPLNALFAADGITPQGSLRKLKHFRGKELVQQVDAYDLLLNGVRSDVQPLESGDTLLVPPLGPEVTVDGMVRRPATYELLKETTLAEVLELAGGMLPTAALRHIEVQRVEAHQKRTMLSLDLTSIDGDVKIDQQLADFKISAGDQIHIFPIAGYNQDAIFLQGHVLRPGKYSYKEGMKLTDLISNYQELLPEPAPHYAEIVRINPPDFHPSLESFDLSSALANPASAPILKPLDTVRIFSRFDFEPPPDVWVGGEVRAPGEYRTSGQAHLRDAIYLAGGTAPDAALDTAQLFRAQADGTLKILSVDLRAALDGNPADNIVLEPRDRILVHRSSARVEPATVYIKGEVAKPGRYPLTTNMKVEDLVRVSGGLKRSADPESADLTRFAAANAPADANQRFDVKLTAAMGGDTNEDIPLRNGDVLTIRQIPQWDDLGSSVVVRGEVQHPATYGIEPGEHLSSLLQRCGGFTAQGNPYGAVLVRREVRELEMRSHTELVERLKVEQRYLKSLPEGDPDQRSLKLTAVAQTETALQQLQSTPPIGRVVIHIPADVKNLASFAKSPADVQIRSGDEIIIPKKNNYVMVSGQVYNPTAVSYLAGKSAKWYLSQSGGLTQIADKSAAFVVRADGSVLSSKNNSGFWSGDPLNAVLKPGDSIVVPEKAPKIGTRNWLPLLQAAQVASSVALTVAYIHP